MSRFFRIYVFPFLLSFCVLLPFSVQGEEPSGTPKETLVLMPLRMKDVERSYLGPLQSALAAGLSEKYRVLTGQRVTDKVREIYTKATEATGEGQECDDTRCMQDIAIAFQTEIIASGAVVKVDTGFMVTLNILNVFEDALLFSESLPCRGCDEFQVVALLKSFFKEKPAGTGYMPESPAVTGPGFGDLFIESEPSGAMVYINGRKEGRTPFEKSNLPVGKYVIELKKGKAYKGLLEITLEADDFIKKKVQLERAKARLKITSTPSGARITLDGRDTGKTTPDVLETLAGDHEIKLVKKTRDGVLSYKGTARAEPDRRVVITITGFEVSVPGGCFQMGDTFDEGQDDEKPVHEVCLDGFFMDAHEVTNSEFENFKPSFTISRSAEYEGKKVAPGDRHPVVGVTWGESKEYCQSQGKRLPTEAEWEYAAREGGRKIRFGTGRDKVGPDEANFNGTAKYKKPYSKTGVYRGKATPVGSFSANGLGLYDMAGNVVEWASDWYGEKYYGTSPKNNPQGPSSGEFRVLRVGSWYNSPDFLRAANRYRRNPTLRLYGIGFRCVRSVQ